MIAFGLGGDTILNDFLTLGVALGVVRAKSDLLSVKQSCLGVTTGESIKETDLGVLGCEVNPRFLLIGFFAECASSAK